jgi:micrococcal nuclease
VDGNRVIRLLVLCVAALASACGRAGGERATAAAGPGAATIERVVDGDTVVVDIEGREDRVRLIGIDTPETHKPDSPVECFGAEASARLAELLPEGTAVTLVRDVEPRDRYDRLLAYVYRHDDDLFVNLAMAADGYAAAYTYPPNVAHADEIVAAAAEARDEGRGLWSSCGDAHVPLAP